MSDSGRGTIGDCVHGWKAWDCPMCGSDIEIARLKKRLARLEAENARLRELSKAYFAILDKREQDEAEHAAAGMTYTAEQLRQAEADLR